MSAPTPSRLLRPLPFALRVSRPSILGAEDVRNAYARTLWLGEAHSPLDAFVRTLDRIPEVPVDDALIPPVAPPTKLREKTQLQILLVCWLLCRGAPPRSPPRTRRKTKAAKRWLAPMHPAPFHFPWQPAAGAPSATEVPPAADATRAAEAHPAAEALLAGEAPPASFDVLESLADHLCLLQFSAHMASSGHGSALFGSAARVRAADDERDEAQWFCADVVEPAFLQRLPRACAMLRMKCFGPAMPSVPTPKRSRLHRVASAPHATAPHAEDHAPQERHTLQRILTQERTRTRTAPAARAVDREVHMLRRFVRTGCTGGRRASVHRGASAAAPAAVDGAVAGVTPVGGAVAQATAPVEPDAQGRAHASAGGTAHCTPHRRKRFASRWSGGDGAGATTLVSATPERPRAGSARGAAAWSGARLGRQEDADLSSCAPLAADDGSLLAANFCAPHSPPSLSPSPPALSMGGAASSMDYGAFVPASPVGSVSRRRASSPTPSTSRRSSRGFVHPRTSHGSPGSPMSSASDDEMLVIPASRKAALARHPLSFV
ncbi:hypothetical protein MSPP1_003645 [Malassezia sp. CBS 17886]|nr:hypothetical protein MSPP1_003645 [Malassezia sp. CBS 17886]